MDPLASWLTVPFFIAGLLSIVTYLIPVLLQNLVFDNIRVDLKKKYKVRTSRF